VLAALAVARLLLLFATPLELYPDEAQYWAWSRTLDWGYFSKPPMIAWLIAASTAIGGNAEAWVRLPAWLCQTAAGGLVFLAGWRLYDARIGFWAATLYALAPGVLLSSGVASTDAPLLLFLSAAIWAYAGLLQGRRIGWAAALGGAVGLAVLSKYAAAYFVVGLVAHALVSSQARRAWRPATLAVAAGALAACLAPNLLWNALNGFDTVRHTASNANWSVSDLFHPAELASFLDAQFGLLGPVPFVALLTGTGWAIVGRGRLEDRERLLLCLLAPPLLLVAVQALLSRANANWAAAFLPPAAILVAAWLCGPSRFARTGLFLALLSQTVFHAIFAAVIVSPAAASAIGLDNGFKRARGWAATSEAVRRSVAAAGPISAVAVDDRFLFNALLYYGRDWLGRPGGPPLTAWLREGEARNQAETTDPLTPAFGRRVLAVGLTPDYRKAFRGDFRTAGSSATVRIPLDRRRTRELDVFVGEGFSPRPRILSGRPTGS